MAIKVFDIGITYATFSDGTAKQELNQALADGYAVIASNIYSYDGEVGERWTLYKQDNMSTDNVTPVAELVAHPDFKYAARNGDYRHAAKGRFDMPMRTLCNEIVDGTYQNSSLAHITPCPECLEAQEAKTDSTSASDSTEYTIAPNHDVDSYMSIYRGTEAIEANHVATFDDKYECGVCLDAILTETKLLREQLASAQVELKGYFPN